MHHVKVKCKVTCNTGKSPALVPATLVDKEHHVTNLEPSANRPEDKNLELIYRLACEKDRIVDDFSNLHILEKKKKKNKIIDSEKKDVQEASHLCQLESPTTVSGSLF